MYRAQNQRGNSHWDGQSQQKGCLDWRWAGKVWDHAGNLWKEWTGYHNLLITGLSRSIEMREGYKARRRKKNLKQ